jgi:hypothetical protein
MGSWSFLGGVTKLELGHERHEGSVTKLELGQERSV